jgi:gamma-glutamyltranspeptidase
MGRRSRQARASSIGNTQQLYVRSQQKASMRFTAATSARDIVRAVRSHAKPGDLTEQDLAGYRALEREPLCGPYRQWRVCSMAPPSAGGVAVLQILGILERTPFARAPPLAADAVHLFSEAGRLAYADRANTLVIRTLFLCRPGNFWIQTI